MQLNHKVRVYITNFIDNSDHNAFKEVCYIETHCGQRFESEPAVHDMSFGKFKGWARTERIPAGAIYVGDDYDTPWLLRLEIQREQHRRVSNLKNRRVHL